MMAEIGNGDLFAGFKGIKNEMAGWETAHTK